MTTPEQNQAYTTAERQSGFRRTLADPPGTGTPYSDFNPSGLIRRIRPRSTTSPVRPNGTRAPLPFYHLWFDEKARVRSGVIGDPTIVVDGSAVLDIGLGSFLNTVAPFAVDAGPFPINIENRARANFFKKLAQGKAQLGAALGEARDTAKGVTRAAEEIASAVSSIASGVGASRGAVARYLRGISQTIRGSRRTRSGKLRRDYLTEKGLEEVRDRWLQAQFEIKPLISDIQDAGQALSDAIFDHSLEGVFKIRAGATDSDRKTATIDGEYGYRMFSGIDVTTSMHISAIYRLPLTATRTINQLGLGNPASVLWEVTAFSWMVDYVVGVGDWLDSMFVDDDGSQFIEGSVSRIQRAVHSGQNDLRTGDPSIHIYGKPSIEFRLNAGNFVRSVLDGRVIPPILPAVRVQMGLNQMANTLSVLSQVAGSPSRVRTR